MSNNFSVYGPGPSSKVRAIVLFATVGVGAAGAGFGFSAGLGMLANFLAVGFCRYLETEEIGTVIRLFSKISQADDFARFFVESPKLRH